MLYRTNKRRVGNLLPTSWASIFAWATCCPRYQGLLFPQITCLSLFFLLLFPLAISAALAQDFPILTNGQSTKIPENLAARHQLLEEEKAHIERTREELQIKRQNIEQLLKDLGQETITETMVEQARLDVDSVRVLQDDLKADIINSERLIVELGKKIEDLKVQEQLLKNPAKKDIEGVNKAQQLAAVQQQLSQYKIEMELEQQHLEHLAERRELAKLRLSLVEQAVARLEEVFRLQQEQSRREAQEDLTTRLQRERQAFQDEAVRLKQRLESQHDFISLGNRRLLEATIQNAEEQAKLIELDTRLVRIDNALKDLEDLLENPETITAELKAGLNRLKALQKEMNVTVELLDRKVNLFEQQKQVMAQQEGLKESQKHLRDQIKKIIEALITDVNDRRLQAQEQLNKADLIKERLSAAHKDRLSKDLLVRSPLPMNQDAWRQLLEGIVSAPKVLFYQMELSLAAAIRAMVDSSALRWLGFIILESILIGLVMVAWRGLLQAIAVCKETLKIDSSFLGTIVLTFLRLLRKNLIGLGIAVALLIGVWMFQVPPPGLWIIVTLTLLWLFIKVPINLAWLLLASRSLPLERRRPQLYRQAFWVLGIGGVLAAVVILARLSSLPDMVSRVFDTVFMLYLLLTVAPALRFRRYVVDLLAASYAEHVWFISLRVISLLFPLTLLVTALLGLLGYLNLAWSVAWHLVVFVLVLIGWLVARSLLNDLAVFLKNIAVRHSDYALLWTQDVINPLHKILGVFLFLVAWMVLFLAYGWDPRSVAVTNVLLYPLFTLGGSTITVGEIIGTVVACVVIIRLSQWIRAVSYRWVFSRILDAGARHSLSVFAQYSVVLVGVLIILNVIGLDLTALAVFAGALGVAIGFGMQAIANNFISGLLLLIERPLRSGDTVQIGTNTGTIERIGIRSLTLKTWDYMDVIIPNSDVITSAFTNWTHSDDIVRTILMIKVSYDTDPHQVRSILERVINDNEAILKIPEPRILLWEFGDSVLTFRIHYFGDFMKTDILVVRSEVMFAIYEGFAAIGISVYFPQQGLHIKEWPEGVSVLHPGKRKTSPLSLQKTSIQPGVADESI